MTIIIYQLRAKSTFTNVAMRFLLPVLCLSFFVFAKEKIDLSLNNVPNFRNQEKLLLPFSYDVTIGKPNAQSTIVVFDSYSCVHCAKFYTELLPILRAKYINNGKLFFIHKEFPLDKRALFASKVVACSADKLKTIQTIYQKQDDLVLGEDYEKKLLSLDGINSVCIRKYDDYEQAKLVFEYGKVLGLKGTPSVYINGKRVEQFSKSTILKELNLIK